MTKKQPGGGRTWRRLELNSNEVQTYREFIFTRRIVMLSPKALLRWSYEPPKQAAVGKHPR
jgi:hypothetical protein